MPIDKSAAVSDYVDGAKAKVEKLIRKYTAKTDKLAKATSDAAQKAYIAGVTDPVSQKLRLVRLKELSEADLNKGMEDKARTTYPAGIDAGQGKYDRRVSPYFDEIDRIVPTLAAKTREARANVMNRVLPIAVGLANKKKALIGR